MRYSWGSFHLQRKRLNMHLAALGHGQGEMVVGYDARQRRSGYWMAPQGGAMIGQIGPEFPKTALRQPKDDTIRKLCRIERHGIQGRQL